MLGDGIWLIYTLSKLNKSKPSLLKMLIGGGGETDE